MTMIVLSANSIYSKVHAQNSTKFDTNDKRVSGTKLKTAEVDSQEAKSKKKQSSFARPKKKQVTFKEPKEPVSPPPKPEQTLIEPYVTYRISALKPRKKSVYHKKDHVDQADQLYLTLKFVKTYDYRHEVAIEPSLRTFRNNPANWEDPIIEQAYIESSVTKHLSFTVGKKLEYEGSGFMVNPSDLLNEGKDVFDPLYQREGVFFSRLKHQSSFGSLSLGYIPKRSQSVSKGKAWLAASTELDEVDFKAQVTVQESDKTTAGLSASRFFGDHLEFHVDSRYQRRQRSVSELDFMQYSPYVGPNIPDQKDDSPSLFYLLGTRYVFPPRRTLVFEYIANESGLLPPDFKRRNADLRQQAEENGRVKEPPTQLLGRHFVFMSYQDDDTLSKTHLAATVLVNTDDQSTYGTFGAKYTLSPITSVEFAPNFFMGKVDSEFGEMPFSYAYYVIFRGKF
jgi:hypothetical protein